jgi:hypothetical protein
MQFLDFPLSNFELVLQHTHHLFEPSYFPIARLVMHSVIT